jgi:hypothetical protein
MAIILEQEWGRGSFFPVPCICSTHKKNGTANSVHGNAHDDDNDADDHEEDEAKDELVRSHATHECAHL